MNTTAIGPNLNKTLFCAGPKEYSTGTQTSQNQIRPRHHEVTRKSAFFQDLRWKREAAGSTSCSINCPISWLMNTNWNRGTRSTPIKSHVMNIIN